MNTSWRSPIDRSRTSRWRRSRDADPLDGRVDGRPVRGAQAGQRRLVGQAPERDDVLDGHLERHRGQLRDDRDGPGDVPPIEPQDRLAAQRDPTGVGSSTPVRQRSSVDLPAPFGPTMASRDALRDGQRRDVEDAPAAGLDDEPLGGAGCGAAHSSYPVRERDEQEQEERRAEEGHDDADRDVAGQPGDEVGRGQERRADERREGQDAARRRPDDQPHDMGHDQPDEADEAGDRDAGGGGQRGQRQEDARARARRRSRGGGPPRRRGASRRGVAGAPGDARCRRAG